MGFVLLLNKVQPFMYVKLILVETYILVGQILSNFNFTKIYNMHFISKSKVSINVMLFENTILCTLYTNLSIYKNLNVYS